MLKENYMKKTLLIKYGGHAMDKEELSLCFAQSIKKFADLGYRIVLTHGGGPHINAMLEKLNITSHFVNGLRYTDDATMQVVEMVLRGTLNSSLVTLFKEAGLNAVGMSGKDNASIKALCNEELGNVGEVQSVDTSLVTCLLENGFLPVIAPIGYDTQTGKSLNINADTASGALAGALESESFVLVTDVSGVLDKEKNLFKTLNLQQINSLKEDGTIVGGMIPKVDSCLHALYKGCKKAYILDGRESGNIEKLLLNNEDVGTLITLE